MLQDTGRSAMYDTDMMYDFLTLLAWLDLPSFTAEKSFRAAAYATEASCFPRRTQPRHCGGSLESVVPISMALEQKKHG